ncbi:MAG: serine hydrolase domain-containing protein [Ginsengibacter sp.]
MKFLLFIAALFCSYTALEAQPAADSISKNPEKSIFKISRLGELVNAYINKGLPGMIILVKDRDSTWQTAAGFSDIEKKISMQTTNELMIASITKMFVAVVTLKLQEEGKLDIDKPIISFRCGNIFKNVPNAEKITIRNLLNHTSGLPDFIKSNRFVTNLLDHPTNNWKREDLLKFLINTKAEFMSGEKGKYSNSNFLLLSTLLDAEFKDSGSHVQWIQKEILEPLQLNHTQYINRRAYPPELAQGYGDLYRNNRLINLTHLNICGTGNGFSGMFSTVEDLSKFLEALLIKKILLKENSLQQMLNFVQDSEEKAVAFGLGIWKDFQDENGNTFAYGHRGREAAYTADLFWFPKQDITYVFLMNCGIGTDSPIKNLFLQFRKEFVVELLKEPNSTAQHPDLIPASSLNPISSSK